MAKLNFTYLPGDGIGPEVGGAAINVLQAISSKFRHNLEIEQHLIGGAAIDVLGNPFRKRLSSLVRRQALFY